MTVSTQPRRAQTDLGAMERGEAGIPRAPTELTLPLQPKPEWEGTVNASEIHDVCLLPLPYCAGLMNVATFE